MSGPLRCQSVHRLAMQAFLHRPPAFGCHPVPIPLGALHAHRTQCVCGTDHTTALQHSGRDAGRRFFWWLGPGSHVAALISSSSSWRPAAALLALRRLSAAAAHTVREVAEPAVASACCPGFMPVAPRSTRRPSTYTSLSLSCRACLPHHCAHWAPSL